MLSNCQSPLGWHTVPVCRSPFDEEKLLLCDICNAGWNMDCLLPPLTTIPAGIFVYPFCLLIAGSTATPPLPPSHHWSWLWLSTAEGEKKNQKNKSKTKKNPPYHSTKYYSHSPNKKNKTKKRSFLQTLLSKLLSSLPSHPATCTAPPPPWPGQCPGQNQGLNGWKIKSSTWFAMERLGPLTSPAWFSLPRGFWIFVLKGDVSLRTGPPPPLEWLLFPPLVAAVLITIKGAEPTGIDRIGVIGALVLFPSQAV